ncbi:MAG: hypothetical protein HQK99_06930 [Nitrospirae bacterium]|nr:hypothetical protein [Nitrospirota bacterium]
MVSLMFILYHKDGLNENNQTLSVSAQSLSIVYGHFPDKTFDYNDYIDYTKYRIKIVGI